MSQPYSSIVMGSLVTLPFIIRKHKVPISSGSGTSSLVHRGHQEEAEVQRHIDCQQLCFSGLPFQDFPVTRRDDSAHQHLLFSGGRLDLEVELGWFFSEVSEGSLVMTFMTNQLFYLRVYVPIDEKAPEVIQSLLVPRWKYHKQKKKSQGSAQHPHCH